ncbi:hypothetical protein CHS0354_004933 [Potamilus streckersoni]|uniref:Methyltransferase type 11 domain-containing protein n=1 Tax=Potamilus streckersoni TaxID=2493646 RepID=A0AAE0TJV9_9BIVA|nr:hypothetical protein CHS0354_004933 [Potamilus streckersoni]
MGIKGANFNTTLVFSTRKWKRFTKRRNPDSLREMNMIRPGPRIPTLLSKRFYLRSRKLRNTAKNCRYLATEPSEGFLAKLKENCPNIESQIGSAEQISLPDNSVKNVVCAQCFHWFATDVSLKEIHRVLIPGGKLIMIWNHKDWSVPWVEKIEDILNEYYKGVPRALNYDWKTVVENFKGFAFNDHKILPGVHFQGPSDAIIAHYSSLSVIASLDPTSKAAVLDKIRSIIQEADLAFDNINIPMKSEMYCCHKE